MSTSMIICSGWNNSTFLGYTKILEKHEVHGTAVGGGGGRRVLSESSLLVQDPVGQLVLDLPGSGETLNYLSVGQRKALYKPNTH